MSVVSASASTTVRLWSPAPFVVPSDLVLRLQKYRDPARAPRVIRDEAVVAAADASRLIAPRFALWRGPVTSVIGTGQVTIDETYRFTSRLLARLLASASHAYAMVLTLGPAFEERVEARFAEGAALEGLLLETAGWAAIMRLAQALRRELADEEAPAGRTVTHRVAPGYGDWALEEQRTLLSLFGDTTLPVTLTEACVLVPRKSISAVFGVIPRREVG